MADPRATNDFIQAVIDGGAQEIAQAAQVVANAQAAHHIEAQVVQPVVQHAQEALIQPYEPPKCYTMDYKGLPVEGKASAERPCAIPLAAWLRNLHDWSMMIDNLHLALDLGYDSEGNMVPHYDWEPRTERDRFRNLYLRQAMSTRLTPSLFDEIKNLSYASQMYHYLVEVSLACKCVGSNCV